MPLHIYAQSSNRLSRPQLLSQPSGLQTFADSELFFHCGLCECFARGTPQFLCVRMAASWRRWTRTASSRRHLATGAQLASGVRGCRHHGDDRQGRRHLATGARLAELIEFPDRAHSRLDSSTATAPPCSVKVHGEHLHQSRHILNQDVVARDHDLLLWLRHLP